MAPQRKIPDRWIPYKACGDVIEGTRIICFKVPIDKRAQQNVREIKQIWDVPAVLAIPKLSAVIDLTNTGRYYDPREFEQANVRHLKILMPGREIPPESKVKQFMDAVDEFLGRDCDSLVGVHCTHGLNRTGYMVCRYLRDRLKIPAEEAIARFEKARGYKIERENYKADLLDSNKTRRITKMEQKPKKPRDINMDLYANPFLDSADVHDDVKDDNISLSESGPAEDFAVTEPLIKKQKLTSTQKRNIRNRRRIKEKKKARQERFETGDVNAKSSKKEVNRKKRAHQIEPNEDHEMSVSEPKRKKKGKKN